MPFEIQIVLLSNVPKHFGKTVEVRLGLPTKNPWSLPFGYKEIFVENKDEYDLFIYSEDDTLIKEKNIRAFIKATSELPCDKIAGFLRYEKYSDGSQFFTTIHSHYNWDPASIRKYGENIYAYFSNEHSACFILTREQLKLAIESGKFLKGPRAGEYDMLCTAATDPYTQCGLQKLICISQIEDFSLHHLPNVYQNIMGVPRHILNMQIERMIEIEAGHHTRSRLFTSPPDSSTTKFKKSFYEKPPKRILDLLPDKITTALSVGSGSGALEEAFTMKGVKVTSIPIDAIIGVCTTNMGIRTTSPDISIATRELRSETFDCIVFYKTLEFFPSPQNALDIILRKVNKGGYLIIYSNNIKYILPFIKRAIKDKNISIFKNFKTIQLPKSHISTPESIYQSIDNTRLKSFKTHYFYKNNLQIFERFNSRIIHSFLSHDFLCISQFI